MSDDDKEGYILEFYAVGPSVKVTAIDPKTLKEVSVVGGKKTSRKELADLAIRKLHYVLKRDMSE